MLTSYVTTTIALIAFSFSAGVASLGINCRGSDYCSSDANRCNSPDGMQALQATLKDAINKGRGSDHWKTQEHVACQYKCCAFYQTNGANGTTLDAYNHVTNLVNHGCKECGSDPTQPGNDVSKGQLTVNYVDNGGPNNCLGTLYCGFNSIE